ncbi:hypothetical protein MIMGU_mgv1a023295mg, partial [Erythranthe guttata]
NIAINGLASLNSQKFHILVDGCKKVKMVNMKISAPANSPNTDGIHIQQSSEVTVMNTHIGTGDDSISVGPDHQNLVVVGLLFLLLQGLGVKISDVAYEDIHGTSAA